jgi:hypothetical protein
MNFLAYLVLITVLLSVGSLVAVVIPTRGTRLGLGAVVFLALIVDGTWLIAPITAWSSALADAVWVGVLALVLLAVAANTKYRGGIIGQPARTGPSARDLTFLALVVALFGVLLLVLPVPLDTDAQGFGYLALTLREGGDYTSLAPWHCEWDGPRTGRGFMLASLIGTGLITVFMDSHFTALLALIFELAFITFVVAFLRTGSWASALFAAICLAGVPLAHQDMTIALIIGYVPWLILVWLGRPRPRLRIWLGIAVIIPLAALVIVSPWLLSITDLLRSDIRSPYMTKLNHWRVMTITQGGICVALVGIGMLVGWRRRQLILLWMTVWIVGLVEFSTLGVLGDNFPNLTATLFKYNYPLGLAWNGPLIPYTVLGGTGLVWLADRIGQDRIERLVGKLAVPVSSLLTMILVTGIVFLYALLDTRKTHRDLIGCISSAADVDAMLWLRDNVPENARILNHPGPLEGDWAPVVTEHDTVYFRAQFFFQSIYRMNAEQDAFRAFWSDPANPDHEKLFRELGVSYVLVPQVFGGSGRFEHRVRWLDPLPTATVYPSIIFEGIPYLRLVYERDGARVYEVRATLGSYYHTALSEKAKPKLERN